MEIFRVWPQNQVARCFAETSIAAGAQALIFSGNPLQLQILI
jgi:hypothetical protein